jgi:uncharacterized membrane protein YoaT (DUF817 family)
VLRPTRPTATVALAQLLRFAWVQGQCCLFAAAVFVGLALSSVVPLPIARYDALLAYALVLTAVFYRLRLETGREVAVIFAFHLIGLALELFKVQVGSWSYPEPAWAKVAGVPLYSGFMYAAVGSYLCQAFRRFDLRVDNFAWLPAGTLAVAAYANFFTHHYLPDLRWAVAVGFLVVLWRSRVSYTVGQRRYAMPLSLSFVLIGFFLWVAENGATLLGAWQYPDQEHVWRLVHVGKWGSWALLVSLSFVLVAGVKMQEGRFYGAVGAVPTVTGSSPAGSRPGDVAAPEVAGPSGRPGVGRGLAVEGDRGDDEQDANDLGDAGQLGEHEHTDDGRRSG